MTDRATIPDEVVVFLGSLRARLAPGVELGDDARAAMVAEIDRLVLRTDLSPRDWRDETLVAIALEFYSAAPSTNVVVHALARDAATPSLALGLEGLSSMDRKRLRAKLTEVRQFCLDNRLRLPSAGQLWNILGGSRTPGKRQKTQQFQLSNFSSEKLETAPDLVDS